MKGLVVCKDKYGATKQYAEWICKALRLPSYTLDQLNDKLLIDADFVILGSSMYKGTILMAKWIKEQFEDLRDKKLFLFVVSTTAEKDKQEILLRKNLPGLDLFDISFFFLPGRVEMKKLSIKDRIILEIRAKLQRDPEQKRKMFKDMDGVDKKNITQLSKSVGDWLTMKIKESFFPQRKDIA